MPAIHQRAMLLWLADVRAKEGSGAVERDCGVIVDGCKTGSGLI